MVTSLATAPVKQPPLSSTSALSSTEERRGLPCHAENVVYFYDNAHVDVGRKGEGGRMEGTAFLRCQYIAGWKN